MGHTAKSELHWKMGHTSCEKCVTFEKIGQSLKTGSHCKKMGHIWKNVTLQNMDTFKKMGPSVKKWSYCEKWGQVWKNCPHCKKLATFEKMSHCEKWVTLEKCVTL